MKRGSKSLRGSKEVVSGRFIPESAHLLRWFRPRVGPRGSAVAGGQTGFGRIELLVVVAIVLVIFTMYWGPSASERRKQVRLNCSNNLQKILIAMDIYANDHGGNFPVTAGATTSEEALDLLVPRYTVDTSIFICPASKDDPLPPGESIRQRKISYAYYMGWNITNAEAAVMSDRQIDTTLKQPGQQVFSMTGKRPGNNHEGRGGNFLFRDGHVEFSSPQLSFATGLTQGVVLLNPRP